MPALMLPPHGSQEATSGGFLFSPFFFLLVHADCLAEHVLQLPCISRLFKQTAPEILFSPNILFSFMTQQPL